MADLLKFKGNFQSSWKAEAIYLISFDRRLSCFFGLLKVFDISRSYLDLWLLFG